jgi:hypothetical protein
MRRITIEIGDVTAVAALDNSATADAVWAALPFTASGQRWGEEIYFEIPIRLAQSAEARDVLDPGELGYWPVGHAFCIFWGPTPASRSGEIRAYSPVNVFGRLEGDSQVFQNVRGGAQVRVERIIQDI